MATRTQISDNVSFEKVIDMDRRTKKRKSSEDIKEVSKRKLVEEIKEKSKDDLLPSMREKTKEIGEKIYNLLKEKGESKVSNIQIMSMIAIRSNYDVMNCGVNATYTPQEISIAFNLYLDMINKINEIKAFPPTVESFCMFIGVSTMTYHNWSVEAEKKPIMDYINSYMLGVLSTGSLVGDLKEISAIYQQKVLGKIEQTTPQVVKHEITTSQDEIISQLNALKKERIIEADYKDK